MFITQAMTFNQGLNSLSDPMHLLARTRVLQKSFQGLF